MPEHVGERRILLVEDEKVVADTLGKILSSNGYDTRVAYSAEAAMASPLALVAASCHPRCHAPEHEWDRTCRRAEGTL